MVWQYLHEQPAQLNLDKSAELLRTMILDAVMESTPVLQLTTHSKCWWTPQLRISRTQMNRAEKEWQKTRLESDHIKFKSVRNQYFRDICTSMTTMWIEFLANAQGTEIFTALHYTKPRKTQRTPPLSFSNITAVTFEEKAVLFCSTMFPPRPVAPSPTDITN